MSSRPTQAESLLYRVGCLVGRLVSYECKTTAPPDKPSTETPAEPEPTGSGTTDKETTPSSEGVPVAPIPIKLDKKLLEQLPAIPDVQANGIFPQTTGPAYAFPLTQHSAVPTQDVLGAQTPAAVAPSTEGWQIFGAAWYWWALTLAVIGGLYIGIKAWITKSFLTIVK